MYDPAGLKVGATQEGVTAKTEIPGKAPAFRLREKEQALSPFVVSNIEPVVAPLGFQRRSLQQPFAVTQNPLSAPRRNGMVRGNTDLPGAERECKKRIRPSD